MGQKNKLFLRFFMNKCRTQKAKPAGSNFTKSTKKLNKKKFEKKSKQHIIIWYPERTNFNFKPKKNHQIKNF